MRGRRRHGVGSARRGSGAKYVGKGGFPLVVGVGIAARALLRGCSRIVLVFGHAGCWMGRLKAGLAADSLEWFDRSSGSRASEPLRSLEGRQQSSAQNGGSRRCADSRRSTEGPPSVDKGLDSRERGRQRGADRTWRGLHEGSGDSNGRLPRAVGLDLGKSRSLPKDRPLALWDRMWHDGGEGASETRDKGSRRWHQAGRAQECATGRSGRVLSVRMGGGGGGRRGPREMDSGMDAAGSANCLALLSRRGS